MKAKLTRYDHNELNDIVNIDSSSSTWYGHGA